MEAPDVIWVKALVRLLSPEEGGRSFPIGGSYRPNHNFGDAKDGEMATGLIDFAVGDQMAPGEERILNIAFVAWPDWVDFSPGREWRLQEGHRVIGRGRIISIAGSNV